MNLLIFRNKYELFSILSPYLKYKKYGPIIKKKNTEKSKRRLIKNSKTFKR